MPSSDLSARLQEAIGLAQAGQQAEARAILRSIVEADPRQEVAWLWLATVSIDRNERIEHLRRALTLNPANATAQQAYAQLTGEVFTPPPSATPRPARAFWRMLTREPDISPRMLLILMAALSIVIAVVVIVSNAVRDDEGGSARPTTAPEFNFSINTPPPTLFVPPTPSRTPRPTITPGPSPTSLWSNPLPTWTPEPSATVLPTHRPPASWTPRPTITASPTQLPATETFTPLPFRPTRPAPTEPPTAGPRTPSPTTVGND